MKTHETRPQEPSPLEERWPQPASGTLAPGAALAWKAVLGTPVCPARKQLRVVGGTLIPAPYQERGESNFRRWEGTIDDSLEGAALVFRGEGEDWERKAFRRVLGSNVGAGPLTISATVDRENLEIDPQGFFGIEAEVYLRKPGRAVTDVFDEPDFRHRWSIPARSGEALAVSWSFDPGDLAAVVITVGGHSFAGRVSVRDLKVAGLKNTVELPFRQDRSTSLGEDLWVGLNLCTRNWPRWTLTHRGRVVFQGPIFDRASDRADFCISLPADLGVGDDLALTLERQPTGQSYPYEIAAIELISAAGRDFEVISHPRFVAAESAFSLLVETTRPRLALEVTCGDALTGPTGPVVLIEPGFHVLKFNAGPPKPDVRITVSDGNQTAEVGPFQVVERGQDPVWISTGDEIYVALEEPAYAAYFRWFVHQRVGNFYQFRPSYQWSGQRAPDLDLLVRYRNLLGDLGIPFAWMVEGRELAGLHLNPPLSALDVPGFHGFQAHENDGCFYYWQHFHHEGFHSDIAARHRPLGGIFAKHRPISTDHGTFVHYDPRGLGDRAEGARRFVANLAAARGPCRRHTGPSVLFRYLFQAGYEWLGAEQMYGPEAVILAALRGASRAYGRTHFGTLHAMQWGSFPFTDPKHAARHYLSLATAYMNGSSHLNTEEGLWTDEYVNDRFSEAGRAHLEVHHRLLDLVETHSREGEVVTDIGILQGRDDAWKCFGRTSVWSQEGEAWAFGPPEASFDLLKDVFYPNCTLDVCGPEGWFSPTPYGPIDLVPLEAPGAALARYKVLVFLGWNTFDAGDFARLADWVEGGGTLLLSLAHLETETRPGRPPAPALDAPILQHLLGEGYRQRNGRAVHVLGRGRVVLHRTSQYPAEAPLRDTYTSDLRTLAENESSRQRNSGWMTPGPRTAFCAWDRQALRVLYLLNVDWQNESPDEAVLHVGRSSYSLTVDFGDIDRIFVGSGFGIRPGRQTTSVLSIETGLSGIEATVQSTGEDSLEIFSGSGDRRSTVTLGHAGVHTLKMEPFGSRVHAKGEKE